MTLAELIQRFRALADDTVEPYGWSDAEVVGYLNEAENEACHRAGFLVDEETADVAVLEVTAGEGWIALSPLVLDVNRAVLDSTGRPLYVDDPARLDQLCPGWDTATGRPESYFLDGNRLRLWPIPVADDGLRLRVWRLPLAPMDLDDADTVEPEIPFPYHLGLVDWALYRAASKRDPDSMDAGLMLRAFRDFEERFGLRPSAYAARQHRERRGHRVRGIAF